MAKVIKIKKQQQEQFSSIERSKKKRGLVVYFLIVCEGEKTEPNYFNSFPKKTMDEKITNTIECRGIGKDPLGVVDESINLSDRSLQKYDRVWAVFDKDSFCDKSFNSAILKAELNKIHCAWSNEAFELWYLLHFNDCIVAMDRSLYKQKIENAINREYKNLSINSKFTYNKNTRDMFNILEKYGNQKRAIARAKELNKQIKCGDKNFARYSPQTQVYKLVEELIGKSDKLKKEIETKYLEGK